MKRLFIVFILICMLLILLASGCTFLKEKGGIEPEPGNGAPSPPVTVGLSFPDGAPPLNQEAELTCIVKAPAISLKTMSVEIRLPEALELVSGSLSWVGDVAEGDVRDVIRATVRAVKTGNWTIELRNAINPEVQGAFSMSPDWRAGIYVSVSGGSAEWGITPPWYKNGGQSVPAERVAP